MLELKNVQYQPATAQDIVLKAINLRAIKGEPVIISGKSGSGKTSLIEVIGGLSSHQKGSIFWNKKSINARQRRGLCGIVFQFPERYFIGLTVAQELRVGRRKLSWNHQTNILTEVGLNDIDPMKPPEELSGGQQRRLSLGVQLIRNPSIMLLDEPTAGLDWSVKSEILSLIEQLSENKILIVVTHEPALFKKSSTNSFELINGKLEKLKITI